MTIAIKLFLIFFGQVQKKGLKDTSSFDSQEDYKD